jgi:phage tail-like protein
VGDPVNAASFFTAKVTLLGGIEVGGGWTKVDGLDMKMSTQEKEEGGNPFFKHLLFNRIEYSPVTLTRPVKADSAALRMSIASIATKFLPVQVEVILHSAKGEQISTWQLMNATITNYKAPSFGITNTGLAEESITVHHQGFLESFAAAMAGKLLGGVGV